MSVRLNWDQGSSGFARSSRFLFEKPVIPANQERKQFGSVAKPFFQVKIPLPDAAAGVFGSEWKTGPATGT